MGEKMQSIESNIEVKYINKSLVPQLELRSK